MYRYCFRNLTGRGTYARESLWFGIPLLCIIKYLSVQYTALIELTPFMPLEKIEAMLVAVQRESVDTVQVELQFWLEIVVVIVRSVTF